MSDYKTIKIEVYRTPDDKPTCARDFRTGAYCKFLLSTRFGLEYKCALRLNVKHLDSYFDAKLGEHGEYTYLKPQDCCIIWSNNE